jgi:Bacteriophage Mu, GemA protein
MFRLITKAQIAKIWATAHDRGIDREGIYLLVPGGSISKLTRSQASELIDRLSKPAPPESQRFSMSDMEPELFPHSKRRPAPATNEQRRYIARLFTQLGWHTRPQRIQGFLRRMAHTERIDDIYDRRRAVAVIEALKAMIHREQHQKIRHN